MTKRVIPFSSYTWNLLLRTVNFKSESTKVTIRPTTENRAIVDGRLRSPDTTHNERVSSYISGTSVHYRPLCAIMSRAYTRPYREQNLVGIDEIVSAADPNVGNSHVADKQLGPK